MKLNLKASGYWKINGKEKKYNGDLYLNENIGGIQIYIRIPNHNKPPLSYLELPLTISFITGTTINGAKLTLLNCRRISTNSRVGTEDVYGYQAQFYIENVHFDKKEDICFSSMRISVPGIIQWGGYSNFIRPDIHNNDSFVDLKNIEPIDIYSNKDYKISYHLSHNFLFDFMKEENILKQTPSFVIESNSKKDLTWFVNKANNMLKLIEIAIGQPLYYDKMSVESPDILTDYGNGNKYPQLLEVIHSSKKMTANNHDNKKNFSHDFLFTLKDLEKVDSFNLEEISTELDPVIELYIDTIYNKTLSISRHFLNMIQALETYHSRRIANSLTAYNARVERILEIRHVDFRKSDRKFLTEGNKGFITLRSRLADLLLSEFEFHFYTGSFGYSDFPRIITKSRNYYIHYNPNLKNKVLEGQDLLDAFYILKNILEFYLLKELGFGEEFIHSKIRERIEFLKINHDVKDAEKFLASNS